MVSMKTLLTITASTLVIMFYQQKTISDEELNLSFQIEPSVELSLAENSKSITWGSQIRYSIQVRDQSDGNSKYGEIDPHQVFLRARFFPNATDSSDLEQQEEKSRLANITGLTLMGQGSCFSCHGDENSVTGPSFSEIAYSYNNEQRSKKVFIHSIRKGSEGQWGNMEMPAYPEYSEEQAAQIVEYIMMQGECKHCWIYSGLEGVLRFIAAPKDVDSGLYLLTASYTSSNGELGKDSILLKIK